MIIDDEPNILKLYGTLLRNNGYRVSEFLDAKEALQYLENAKQQIDLIIADVNMPEMTGIQFLEHIQNITAHSSIPLIFLSAVADSNIQVSAFNLGAVDYLTKPVKKELFLSKIKALLQSYALKKLNEALFMEGNKKDKQVDEIISICESEKLTGFALLCHEGQVGVMCFSGGMLEKIEVGDEKEAGALEKLAQWEHYNFAIFYGHYDENLVKHFISRKAGASASSGGKTSGELSGDTSGLLGTYRWSSAGKDTGPTDSDPGYKNVYDAVLGFTTSISKLLNQKPLSSTIEFNDRKVLTLQQENGVYELKLFTDKQNAETALKKND